MDMKATGVVRNLDELGRVTIPIELRRTMNIRERDALEIFVDEDRIILQRYDAKDDFNRRLDNLNSTLCVSNLDKETTERAVLLIEELRGVLK